MRGFLVAALLALSAAPLLAQEAVRAIGPRLYLTGRATLDAAPDFASVSVGVSHKAADPGAAIDQTSAAAARIAAAAREFGIEGRDIQTSYVSLEPVYRTVRDGSGATEQRLDGYRASNSVLIRVRDLGRLGPFMRTVVEGGANRIGGVDFELAEPRRLEIQASAAAVRDARSQAEAIAGAAGVKLGRIEEIRTGRRAGSPEPRTYRMAPAAAAPERQAVPIEAGSLQVLAEVEVVFSIEQP